MLLVGHTGKIISCQVPLNFVVNVFALFINPSCIEAVSEEKNNNQHSILISCGKNDRYLSESTWQAFSQGIGGARVMVGGYLS